MARKTTTLKMILLSIFLLYQGLTRVPGAIIGQEWQYITVKVSHQNRTMFDQGDAFPYNVTLYHKSIKNATDSYAVSVKFYLPFFIQYANCSKCESATIGQSNNQLVVKVSRITVGSEAKFTFVTLLDDNKILRKGLHNIVTPIEVSWYNQYTTTEEEKYKGAGVESSQPRTLNIYGVEISGCSKPLGMSNGKIKSHQLIASTSDPTNRPEAAMVTSTGWCALKLDQEPYIQLLLAHKSRITKITTWSRTKKPHWVTSYEVEYSLDNTLWRSYGENGFTKLFEGNTEMFTPKTHWFLYPFSANHVKIRPKTRKEMCCMRFELYGCELSDRDNCVDPIGMESGKIPDSAITDDLNGGNNPPSNVRLNKAVSNFPFGWMASTDGKPPSYIQLDLGSVFKITRFAIQGAKTEPNPLFFVKSYKISSSNTSLDNDWHFLKERNDKSKVLILPGPPDNEKAKYAFPVFLPMPEYARYFRVYPVEYHSLKVMQMELYGCVADAQPSKTVKESVNHYNRRVILLDKTKNTFYVCVYNLNTSSCFYTDDGKMWQAINKRVVGLLGLSKIDKCLYGMGQDLRYMISKDQSDEWTYISNEEWDKARINNQMEISVSLDDILVGDVPHEKNQWVSTNGFRWGVSGKGIHMKVNSGASWELFARWKCCGQ